MEKIGKYQIEGKIGSGGFGEVFKGYDPFIKRHVAVKTCNAGDQETRTRFFQEAEIVGNLHHRNITTVYDFGIHDELPYLIQEYLSGEDLHAKIKRRDFLPYPEKLYYLLQIARGLGHAHGKGVIHRDIKPANIRILEDGTAKIMDFGIAKLAQQESGLTQTGMALGTAAYLAPEQVRGEPVDLRTDIFSFGVLAYELLTYERPFQGEQISTVIYQILHQEPKPIVEAWPAAPLDLVTLIDRCLRKDATQRFDHGNALVKDLEGLQKRGRTAAEPSPVEPPPIGIAPPTVAATPEPPTGAGLDDISYSLTTNEAPTPAPGQTTIAVQVAPARMSTAASLAILLLLASGAAAAGWWFGMREDAPVSVTPPTDVIEIPVAPQPDLDPAADAEPTIAASVPPETEFEAEEASPPPAPKTGRLILQGADWTDAMTVRINGKKYSLHGLLNIELPPGSYKAVFELATEGYSAPRRTLDVKIAAGQSQRLPIAIPRPGALTVRPLPRRSHGQVLINGELVGQTPLSKIWWTPGEYAIEIRPREGEGEGITQTIQLTSGQEVILSFDLAAGTVKSRTKPLAR